MQVNRGVIWFNKYCDKSCFLLFQLNYSSLREIRGFSIQGSGAVAYSTYNYDHFVTGYNISYSLDGQNWRYILTPNKEAKVSIFRNYRDTSAALAVVDGFLDMQQNK